MSKRVRRRRGTQAQHDEFTGADGELTVNTTDYSVHAHDGSTAGGFKTYGEGNPPDFSDLTGTSGVFTTSSPPSFSDVTGSIADGQVPESAVTQHISASTDLSDHESQVVELGGDFDAGEDVRCERIGNWVTITATGQTTHSATTFISASSNVIPSNFRPSSDVSNMYSATNDTISEVTVFTNGDFSIRHFNWDGTYNGTKTNAGVMDITYLIT